MKTCSCLALGLLVCAAAHANLPTGFEAGESYNGSLGGTQLTYGFGGGGQDQWVEPINGGADLNVYTYAGNTLGLNPNLQGDDQFIGGTSAGSPLFPRAQHAQDFSTSTTWGISYDLAANWLGQGSSTPNLSSVTLQPTGGNPSRYFNAINNFVDLDNPGAGWKAEYSVFDANGDPLNNQSPGAAWDNLAVNHWYRQSTTVDFTTNTITGVAITDLSTGISATASPAGWYLHGGASGNDPYPTDVRFFVGGEAGNTMGWDRLTIAAPSTWYADADGDGYGDPGASVLAADQPSGYVAQAGDCDDTDPAVNPGATETCNGIDDNCNGQTDEGLGSTWYADADGDGYGDAAHSVIACAQPNGYVAQAGDCDDTNAAVNPSATEACNGIDDNCNGLIDDGVGPTWYLDFDGDGYGDATKPVVACSQPNGYVAIAGDCNDGNANIYPGAPETCNGADDNCDGQIDEGLGQTWYADFDGDGYGDAGNTTIACAQPGGYVANATDCDDSDALVNPGAMEVCGNGIDDNCDGQIDEGCCPVFFAPAASYATRDTPNSVAVADFNGDGLQDLAVTDLGTKFGPFVSILLGKSDGTFTKAVPYTVGASPRSVAAADFNHDGIPDLATANSGSNNVSILLGKGDGTFNAKVNYSAGGGPYSLAVGFFDADQSPDLAVANYGGNNVSILFGNSDGSFQGPVNYGTGTNPACIALGDFNGDGRPDLAVANYGSNTASILLADSAFYGKFKGALGYATGKNPRGVAVGDFDRNGSADLAVANFGANNVSILRGNGDGTFKPKADYATGARPYSIAAADLDGDLLPDLAVANSQGNSVSVLIADPAGSFRPRVNFTTGSNPQCVVAADVNRDGRPDLVVANANANNVSVLANNGGTWLWYADADGDGYGDAGVGPVRACARPPGYIADADDCDDADPAVHPRAREVCDGIDNNCNGGVDEHTAPMITKDPQDVYVWKGKPAVFTVSDALATTRQWRKDGNPILGATGQTYQIASAQKSDEGTYDAVITNPCGQAVSAGALLSVELPPAVPTGLKGSESPRGSAALTWLYNLNGKAKYTGFEVQRSEFAGGSWQAPLLVATVTPQLLYYTDSPGAGVWRYRVRTINGNVHSAWTAWAAILPTAPSGLTVKKVNGKGSISWTDNSDFEGTFTIQRDDSYGKGGGGGGIVTLPPQPADTTQYTDTPPKHDKYRYRIRADNAAGSTAWSNWVLVSL